MKSCLRQPGYCAVVRGLLLILNFSENLTCVYLIKGKICLRYDHIMTLRKKCLHGTVEESRKRGKTRIHGCAIMDFNYLFLTKDCQAQWPKASRDSELDL